MKKIIFALGLSLLAGSQLSAQQNPAVANPFLTPSPLNNVGSQFDISFDIGNSGSVDISGTGETQQMKFTISLGKCAPSVGGNISATGINALSGTVMNYFDVIYDASINTFFGTQKANVSMGMVPNGMHHVVIHVQVTTLSSTPTTNDIGANLNVQPNAVASATSQPTGDDHVAIFTHTSGSPLPVVLNDFSSRAAGCSVVLDWHTANELDFDHFEIEHSIDKGYAVLASVKATGDNSAYTYTDNKPASGMNTYRLKMVDRDGKFTYSSVTAARTNCATDAAEISVYPNPALEIVHIKGIQEGATLRLMDATGRIVAEKMSGGATETLDMSRLPAALYNLQVIRDGAIHTVKVSKQ